MKRRFGPSLYFANDKVIFDSLNQHQVNVDLIKELFFERGIIVSSKTTKEELAKYFSRLTADYFDHESIAVKLGRVAKHERITASELSGEISEAEILASLAELKVKLEDAGDKVDITVDKVTGRIVAEISYEHIDYTKIDLRQVEPRDAIIEFSKVAAGSYLVRSTQNNEIDPLVEQVVKSLEDAAGGKLARSRINLQSHISADARTKFFEALTKGIEGYNFLTVTEAYCFKPKTISEEDEDEEREDDVEKLPYVERVSLRGEGVNRSFVIKELYEKDYYIIKVVWQVREKARIDSDIFELEAQFSHPDTCTGFSYRTKSVLIVDEGKITSKRRGPKKDEEDTLFRLIELAAKQALLGLSS
jgi:hypothetical protein